MKLPTIRVLVSFALKQNWPLSQLDDNNAFLHGDLHEDVYMQPPLGLVLPDSSLVSKLNKSLYGLKQASRHWYDNLSDSLRSQGYPHSQNDFSLFSNKVGASVVFLAIYVELWMIYSSQEMMNLLFCI